MLNYLGGLMMTEFDAIMYNLKYGFCQVPHPDPKISNSNAVGRTYKQARNFAQMIDASAAGRRHGSKPWYPDLPLYRMGK